VNDFLTGYFQSEQNISNQIEESNNKMEQLRVQIEDMRVKLDLIISTEKLNSKGFF